MSGPWQAARRLLAVRLDGMGDVLMTEPALAAVRGGGRRHVTLLTSDAGCQMGRLLPSVDEVIHYPAPWMKASAPRDAGLDLMMIERLRARGYDAALIFTVSTQSALPAALLCHLAGIRLRAAACRENPYQLLTDWIREEEPAVTPHEVERQLGLVRHLGFAPRRVRMALRLRAEHRSGAVAALRRAGLRPERPWLMVHPGATAPSRQYPPQRFGLAVGRLVREDGWQAVVAGGPEDGDLMRTLRGAANAPTLSLTGLQLGELAAAISMAGVFIGNNSGPMHMAAALGTPSVITYAQTNPQHTPWRATARVLQRDVPCANCLRSVCPLRHHACLRLIEPGEIVDAARSLASTAPARRARPA